MMLSIITVVNKCKVFREILYTSLKGQENIEYELIVKDNRNNQYHSLSEAYNEAVKEAKGEWLMFVHPDICFLSKNELTGMLSACIKLYEGQKLMGIFGVAGATYGPDSKVVSCIVHSPEKIYAGDKNVSDEKGYQVVQSLDACCFMMPANVAYRYSFWEGLKGIHMCVEELCFRLNENGLSAVVIPANCWHISEGKSLDKTYYREALKVSKRHPGMDYFNTTCVHARVDFLLKWRFRYLYVRIMVSHCLRNLRDGLKKAKPRGMRIRKE